MSEQQQPQKFELIYHPIRGLGSPCRAAFIFNGIDFVDNQTSDWWAENGTRARVVKVLPFCNLPTLVLPSGDMLTQTATVIRYIGNLGETKPKTELDAANVSMVLDHLIEFNGEKLKMTYGEKAADNMDGFFAESIPYYFGTLEQWVEKRKSEFIASSYITVADLFFTEYVESFLKLKGGNDWLKAYPALMSIHNKVVEHPKLKEYYAKVKDQAHNNPRFAVWH